jgi:hypothetical protein
MMTAEDPGDGSEVVTTMTITEKSFKKIPRLGRINSSL